jgi:hypothetical protein
MILHFATATYPMTKDALDRPLVVLHALALMALRAIVFELAGPFHAFIVHPHLRPAPEHSADPRFFFGRPKISVLSVCGKSIVDKYVGSRYGHHLAEGVLELTLTIFDSHQWVEYLGETFDVVHAAF